MKKQEVLGDREMREFKKSRAYTLRNLKINKFRSSGVQEFRSFSGTGK